MTQNEADWLPLLKQLVPMNRTIVSDDMDRAADLLDKAYGTPAKRYRYASGKTYGSWVVPPSWNVREAYLSDGWNQIASYQDQPLFLAPYSMPFNGWIDKKDLLEHTFVPDAFNDVFRYQHRVAYDFQKQLKRWEISLSRRSVEALDQNRYYLKIDVDVHSGHMNVLEYTVPGKEETTVAMLSHLCHPGQANDGLTGVLAGLELLKRFQKQTRRFTYKLLVMPETIGSAVHVAAQNLNPKLFYYSIFLETMGAGDRLYLKKTRTGQRPMDSALRSIVRERPEIGILDFHSGYGNDELVFDFPNVNIPSLGIQYYPFAQYHTSRDSAALIDWEKWTTAVDLAQELFDRLEADRKIALKFPGPPYLSRYRLYYDAISQPIRFKQVSRLLALCDGEHTLLQMCEESGLPFAEVKDFFDVLRREGLLKT